MIHEYQLNTRRSVDGDGSSGWGKGHFTSYEYCKWESRSPNQCIVDKEDRRDISLPLNRASSCSLLLRKLVQTADERSRRSIVEPIRATHSDNRFITIESNFNLQRFGHFPNLEERSRWENRIPSISLTSINDPIPAGTNTSRLAPESSRYKKIITLLMERHKTKETEKKLEGKWKTSLNYTGAQRQSNHCLAVSPIIDVIFKSQKVKECLGTSSIESRLDGRHVSHEKQPRRTSTLARINCYQRKFPWSRRFLYQRNQMFVLIQVHVRSSTISAFGRRKSVCKSIVIPDNLPIYSLAAQKKEKRGLFQMRSFVPSVSKIITW